MPPRERTGVLVLKIWIEAGTNDFRARMTTESELGSGERVRVHASSLDEILLIISRWVEEFLARAAP